MSQKLSVPHPKKKIDRTPLIVLSVIGVVLLIGCVVLGAAFDYALGADGSIDGSKISPAFRYVTSHPEVIISAITKKDGYAPKMLFVGVCVIGIFALYKYSEEPKRLHRRGTEHGSAKWADEKEVRALAEKEKKPYQLALRDENGGYLYDDKGEFICADVDYNIVLAKDVYLALNTKQHRLNLNALVIGGSGSGKTLFWVITNILQLNTSFVITDPKGEIYQATAKLLKEAGYEVRVFNTIQMEHSNNYNPFHYIYDHNGDLCEDNVKKMADVLFQATKGDGEKDDFWSQKGQTVLLALMFLLIEQSEYDALFDENGKIIPGTRDETNLNFYAITEKMRGLQYPPQGSQKPDGFFLTQNPGESDADFAARQEKGFLCPLDREFLELQRRKPDTLAYRLYKEIRNAPEETGQSFVSSANVKTFWFNLRNLKNLTCCDNVHLETLGDKKTALFMSNIVILIGSMRRGGNTDLLARKFAEGAAEHNSVEIISVADYKVAPCIGCNTCFTREGNACCNHDMDAIYEKLWRADVLVIASPVYFYGISAELKAIIDRLHTPMRNTFAIRKLALLLVGAAKLPNLFDPILMQYQMVLDFFHLQDCGKVLVRGVKDKGDIIGRPEMDEAYRLGLTIT